MALRFRVIHERNYTLSMEISFFHHALSQGASACRFKPCTRAKLVIVVQGLCLSVPV